MKWILKISFSDGEVSGEECGNKGEAETKAKLAIRDGYLFGGPNAYKRYPPHSIVKCEYSKKQ